jgi:small subunit ribosomal protein S19e
MRSVYGGKKDRGVAPGTKAKGSGAIARTALQQLEEAGFVRALKSGRVVSPQGQSMLDNVAYEVKQDLLETIPGLAKY